MSMSRLTVGVIVSKDVYSDYFFRTVLENYFSTIAGKLYNRLKEEFGEDLPEDTVLKIEINIKPFLEDRIS